MKYLFALFILLPYFHPLAQNNNGEKITFSDSSIVIRYLKEADSLWRSNSYKHAHSTIDSALRFSISNDVSIAMRIHLLKSNILLSEGIYDECLAHCNNAIDLIYKTHPIDSNCLAEIHMNFGMCYQEISKYDLALKHHNESLGIFEDLFGQNSIQFAKELVNIANVLTELEKFDEALEKQLLSLQIKKILLSEESNEVAINLNNIAMIYFYKSDFNKAIEFGRTALEIRLKNLGQENELTGTSYNNLGISYAALGQLIPHLLPS
ncbi:MAG: tetratricopeptide repeat protein [Saprospiraceae bacterium]|nr:tetratricopeptide repeat protein [Saprospiraceae bacterium]